MNILIIGNPISGSGKAVARIADLERRLTARGHRVETYLTRAAGDARARAREIGNGNDNDVQRLVVAGGDGTLNEVLNGLPSPSRVPLAQLPPGTANLLVREYKLPWKPAPLVKLLERGRVEHLDVGVLRGRRFLMLASAGIDAAIVGEVHRRRRGKLGMHKYLTPILAVTRTWRTPRLEITVDGNRTVRGAFVVVSKIRTYGGLFQITERTRIQPGRFAVVVFPRDSLSALARYAFTGRLRTAAQAPGVQVFTGRRVRIDAERPVPIQVDGDSFGTTPAEIELQPGGAAFVLPERAR